MKRFLLLLMLVAVLLPSCTIEKRLFRKGWHVEWKHRDEASGVHEKETEQSPAVALRETHPDRVPQPSVEVPESNADLQAPATISTDDAGPRYAVSTPSDEPVPNPGRVAAAAERSPRTKLRKIRRSTVD